jgi:hypothetical protein
MTHLITTSQAAQIIGCERRHVVKLFHAGLLAGEWFGDVIQISKASAQAYAPASTGPRASGETAIERAQPYNRKRQ